MADRYERYPAGMDGQESVISGYFSCFSSRFFIFADKLVFYSELNTHNHMKTNYERPEAEDLKLVLEENFLETGGNFENPDDPGTEIILEP